MTDLKGLPCGGNGQEQRPKTPAPNILQLVAPRQQTSRQHAVALGVVLRYLKQQPPAQGRSGNRLWSALGTRPQPRLLPQA